jgi:hypothetical protein
MGLSEDGGRVGDSSDGIRALDGCSVSKRADGFSDEGSLADETSLVRIAFVGCSEDGNSLDRDGRDSVCEASDGLEGATETEASVDNFSLDNLSVIPVKLGECSLIIAEDTSLEIFSLDGSIVGKVSVTGFSLEGCTVSENGPALDGPEKKNSVVDSDGPTVLETSLVGCGLV